MIFAIVREGEIRCLVGAPSWKDANDFASCLGQGLVAVDVDLDAVATRPDYELEYRGCDYAHGGTEKERALYVRERGKEWVRMRDWRMTE